uniref:FBD domain-containing protein n=1 Tax=Leersia perrieri TaxID=77586 RepID=A0A0D9WUZ2_9ORYZ
MAHGDREASARSPTTSSSKSSATSKNSALQWEDAFDPIELCQIRRDAESPRFKLDGFSSPALALAYLLDISNLEYLMEDMIMLPGIVSLNLAILANGHAIGPSLFHVLRMWTSIRRLTLVLHISKINNFRGTEHEIALVKRLFSWAAALKEITINF